MGEISELRKSLIMRLGQVPEVTDRFAEENEQDIQDEQDNSGIIKSIKPVGILILSCLSCTSMLNELV